MKWGQLQVQDDGARGHFGRLRNGSLGDLKTHSVAPLSHHFVAVRYDGSLDFMGAVHFEKVILLARANYPKAKAILVGDGINSIDATGEDKILPDCPVSTRGEHHLGV